jgi:mRNA interferase RelE/StbE
MASYEVLWKHSAERDLRNIDPQQIPRLVQAVAALEDNPFPPQHRRLRGSEREYRLRVGDYRVIYEVDTTRGIVTVYHVRHRREAYRH